MSEGIAVANAAQCPLCQRVLPAAARFCPGCGQQVGSSAHRPEAVEPLPSSNSFESSWAEIKRVAWLFGLLLFNSFVFGLSARGSTSPWPELVSTGASAVIVLAFSGARYREILPLFRLSHLDRRRVLELLGVALVLVLGMTVYFALIERIGVPLMRASTDYLKWGWHVPSMLLMISVMPALFEELAFRGVVQSALERVVGTRQALLIQAALFSVLHLLPLMFPSHFLMGLCLGYMRLRSRSLVPGMLLHAFWNALVLFKELV